MKVLLKSLIFSLLASTPCSTWADETENTSFLVELEKWEIAKGDTLSEIAQKLLPDNKPLREQLMYKILELNPVAFPSNNIDFMLAFNTLFFPSIIDGINIKQLLQDTKNPIKEASFIESSEDLFFKDKEITSLEDDAISIDATTDTPLYVAPIETNTLNIDTNKTNINRFYSISEEKIETELKTTINALHNHQYVTEGNLTAKVTIADGPSFLLEPNTRIKVYSQIDNNGQCQINLIYGLIRVLERNEQLKHCSVHTQVAKVSASNSAFVVRVCHQGSCVIETKTDGKSSLPAGLYYGVIKGKITVTDEIREYKIVLGEINYYSSKNKKPLTIKHFEGLLFNDADLIAIKNNRPQKKKFAWGTIQSHQQDDDYIESHLDIKTNYSATELNEEVQIIEQEVLEEEDPKDKKSDNTSTLDRFN